jgi:hypothetical protein
MVRASTNVIFEILNIYFQYLFNCHPLIPVVVAYFEQRHEPFYSKAIF